MIESRNHKSCLRRVLPVLFLLSAGFFTGSVLLFADYKQMISGWTSVKVVEWDTRPKTCESEKRPKGTETLPKGIVSPLSDMGMRSLWGDDKKKTEKPKHVLAMAVGIKQKLSVKKIVQKFPSNDFVLILFHYDGIIDEWRDMEWHHRAIHISAMNQTKWWFAKRFLHPDIVSEYDYIFLWDEDLGVDNFHAGRYLSIIKEEGLDISQPALDPESSEDKYCVNRKVVRIIGQTRLKFSSVVKRNKNFVCRFVEMMAPVFSKASWRCTWHMIQGDRTKNVGIVDSEYIVHYGLPTLGGSASEKAQSSSNQSAVRLSVKKWSFVELERFKNRWKKAVKDDECWTDKFQ
ncbi:hypothetical protein SADUNF_Sadunf14G0134800 [Salix dunnii]|uniref:Uncharacterized protein n=1 Tax=Salix dunnii TaxID=1413687 RepID=A0A835JGA2_9ROSI|nr:hypothetical protein SADUNF_Sadunf14G0134800 [Salix dunnii]